MVIGDGRRETGDRKLETRDGRSKMGDYVEMDDRRQKMGDGDRGGGMGSIFIL